MVQFCPAKTDLDFLAEKVVEYICVLKTTFQHFQTSFLTQKKEESCPKLILRTFSELLVYDYSINKEKFFNNYISKYLEGRIDNFNIIDGSTINLAAEYTDFYSDNI